jgi:5-aminopentanamidase
MCLMHWAPSSYPIDMPGSLTVALYQCMPGPLDVAGNLQRLEGAAQQAAESGAHVLVCPEMFVTGYNIGHAAVLQLAQTADGGYAQAIAAMARRHNIALVYGYPERAPQGPQTVVFNAAQWISAQGERLLNYRKTRLFGELDSAQFVAAEPVATLLDLHGWRIGLLICYDVEFPENTRRLALAGADLVVVPTANMANFDEVSQAIVPLRAFENQIYLAYANYVGTEGDLQYGGLSTLAGPDGSVLAQAGRKEALIVTTLSWPDLDSARRALDINQ